MSANKVLFADVSAVFQKIKDSKSSQQKKDLFASFMNSIDRQDAFQFLRLFLVKLDSDRTPYHIKESTFTRILTNILCLPKTSSDFKMLQNYKSSSIGGIHSYADAAFALLRKSLDGAGSSKLTVSEVNKMLDEIAAAAGKDARAQEAAILKLFKSTAKDDWKWLIRLLLKDMHLALSKSFILETYHKDASKYIEVNVSLSDLCRDLQDRNLNFGTVEIQKFKPFRPMLSIRCGVAEFHKAVTGSKDYFVEEKFDGERFQIHYFQGEFKYFSRNGKDFTKHFDVHSKSLDLNADSAILDGEMMIWLKHQQSYGSKGMAADIKKVQNNPNIQQCFCAFDLVFLNGEVLTERPLIERLDLLKKVVKEKKGVIELSSYQIVRSKQGILDALNASIDRDEEGIVFKCPQSKYVVNERTGWWKVKLEYFEGLITDLDVLIIGGYHGGGGDDAKSPMNGFLVAVKDNQKNGFLSFAKISTGLNNEERELLNNALKPHWLDVGNQNEHEKSGVFWGKVVPDKWIKPENSCCLEVRGSELIRLSKSKDYRTSYTLRFPRILRVKSDKGSEYCLTVPELLQLTNSSNSVVKLAKRHLQLSDLPVPKKKRRREIQTIETDEVTVKNHILGEREFLVLSGKGDWILSKVKHDILENGGKIVLASRDEKTYCILVGDPHERTNTYNGGVDIVSIDWLQRVLQQRKFRNYTPIDVVKMAPESEKKFRAMFDSLGDSYHHHATKNSIQSILEKFVDSNTEGNFGLHPEEVFKFFDEIELPLRYRNILSGLVAYFDHCEVINEVSSPQLQCDVEDKVYFLENGGRINSILDSTCDCIIANKARFEALTSYLKKNSLDIPVFENSQQFVTCVKSYINN